LQLSAAAYTTDENAGWLSIPVTRTGSSNGAITVSYATANGTATSGSAYGSVDGTISWADGDSTPRLITIPILDQLMTTGSQTFSVNLSSPESGATLGSLASATVTVLDNDPQQTDYCHPNSPGGDTTATYCTTPNFPTFGTAALALPANPSAQLGGGLKLESSATNLFSLVMGSATPGANMTTGQQVRGAFYMNYITGNLNNTFGSPIDTGQANNSTFAAVARHYEAGDPNDVHLMAADGLHLRAMCSQNHNDCTPGHVFAGMIRVPAEIRPGMTVKVRYKSPAGPHSWAPIWLASGSEYSPGPGGNPYQGFGTTSALARVGSAGNFFEIDLNDNYPRWENNPSVPMGEQLDYGIANIYGVKWNTAPHPIYWANGNGYSYQTASAPAFESLPINWSTGFHDLVLSWQNDNLLYEFVDGKLVAASYMEYPASTYVDALAAFTTKTLAMNLVIGNQAIPSFTPGGSSATENDGITDGWTIVVQEISVWNGNVAAPDSYQAAPNGCDASCQQP
jgi:hypothetical protein